MKNETDFAGAIEPTELAFLRLLHLADSALPIGAVPHSFGLETLVDGGALKPAEVRAFLREYLREAGVMEAVYCRAGFQLARTPFAATRWVELNNRLGALKAARESRAASAALGGRLLALLLGLMESEIVREAMEAAHVTHSVIHHSPAFGLSGGILKLDEESVVPAFLHQSIMGLVSACQRLMPMGQSEATRIIWDLKPAIREAARRSREFSPEEVPCFLPVLDWGAMEHPALSTRLFIS